MLNKIGECDSCMHHHWSANQVKWKRALTHLSSSQNIRWFELVKLINKQEDQPVKGNPAVYNQCAQSTFRVALIIFYMALLLRVCPDDIIFICTCAVSGNNKFPIYIVMYTRTYKTEYILNMCAYTVESLASYYQNKMSRSALSSHPDSSEPGM